MSEGLFHNIPPCVKTYAPVLDHILNRGGVGSRRKSITIPKTKEIAGWRTPYPYNW